MNKFKVVLFFGDKEPNEREYETTTIAKNHGEALNNVIGYFCNNVFNQNGLRPQFLDAIIDELPIDLKGDNAE